jgi:hypothetical protein
MPGTASIVARTRRKRRNQKRPSKNILAHLRYRFNPREQLVAYRLPDFSWSP